MSTKNVLMFYCAAYGTARFIATTAAYFSGQSGLQLAVLIIAEAVSLIGIMAGIIGIRHHASAGFVRGLLAFNSAAAITNILITRAAPLPQGAGISQLLIMGTIFDLLLFVCSLFASMPESEYHLGARSPRPHTN